MVSHKEEMKTKTYLVRYQKHRGGNRRNVEVTVQTQPDSTKKTILADIVDKIAKRGQIVDPSSVIIMDTKLIKEEEE
jgi:hypothetical protein